MSTPSRHLAAAALLVSGIVPATARAQAICSAPHSSPVLASGGSIGTLPPGAGFIQVSAFRQVSSNFFGPTGPEVPFLADGRVRTNSAYVTGSIGVVPGIDLWGQVPFHQVRYVDQGGERTRTGLGDPRFSVRLSPELFDRPEIPVSLRAGVKLPGSDFPVDATIIPLGEGQRDFELSLETGRSFERLPLYVLAWAGYRWRQTNESVGRKPGNERFFHAAAGLAFERLRLELGAEYLTALPPEQLGIEVTGSTRRLFQLQPTIGYAAGGGAFEFTALVPVSGRNLPSGPGVSMGYRFAWGMF